MCYVAHLKSPIYIYIYICLYSSSGACLSSNPYQALPVRDLHGLVRVMQCFGGYRMVGLGQAHVSGGRNACEPKLFCLLYSEVSQSLWVSGLGGCAWGTVSRTNHTCLRSPDEQGRLWASRFAALSTAPGKVRVRAACRLYMLPRMINTSIFSCHPFDLYYKQVALIDVYPFQKVNMCLKEVWTILLFRCGLLAFCRSSGALPPSLVLECSLRKTC